ncbi:shikimate kinase [Chitinivibrio alkaliphilus]|uniref:Shikimate kinase n=1 Tax=Chitinivibrio alkaliphilus ACht1 TaxID=1313304 RepID=U7DDG7_9BACT|nr:shikimate kinase [Chitinivibrio alkaliphilus]ERP38931.1 shikimate kinase [Chitinivibrio alkaliphilus ACht1]
MNNNITLIGMPGAGKSTVGIILAKLSAKGFIDTDILIQINHQESLQSIIDTRGHLHLRDIEEQEICKLNVDNHVIATGGSAVYGARAMEHLQKGSTLVYLEASLEEIRRRIPNFDTRGIARRPDQSLDALFQERTDLYRQYAHVTIDTEGKQLDSIAEEIITKIS